MTPPVRPNHWKLHLTLVAGLTLCVVAFVIEIRRASHGHWGAWVYVVEWPVFAIYGTFVWWRLTHPGAAAPATVADDAQAHPTAADPTLIAPAVNDPELDAWNAYVERLNASENERPAES